jgi:hypothetical protein
LHNPQEAPSGPIELEAIRGLAKILLLQRHICDDIPGSHSALLMAGAQAVLFLKEYKASKEDKAAIRREDKAATLREDKAATRRSSKKQQPENRVATFYYEVTNANLRRTVLNTLGQDSGAYYIFLRILNVTFCRYRCQQEEVERNRREVHPKTPRLPHVLRRRGGQREDQGLGYPQERQDRYVYMCQNERPVEQSNIT